MFWALVGTIDTVSIILSVEGHVRILQQSGLFSAFSYIIRITDAHEQPVNSASVSDKTQALPCVHQQG